MAEVMILEIPFQDLEFKVDVPAGSRIVAALETPSGQLIRLNDLNVEQGGVPVKDLSSLGFTGPVKGDRVKQGDETRSAIRDAWKHLSEEVDLLVEETPPRDTEIG